MQSGMRRARMIGLRGAVLAVTTTALGALWLGGCGKRGEPPPGAPSVRPEQGERAENGEAPPPVSFEVRRDSSDIVFFWFDEHGSAHQVERAEDVPAAARENVRVLPPRVEQRPPGWVFVANLREPDRDGRFPVRAVASERFAQSLASLSGLAAAMAPPPAPTPSAPLAAAGAPTVPHNNGAQGQARIVIYGASWCGACHQAAAWMRANNIPFVERDIEREPDAQREMMALAMEQGVPTGSIPIISVNGRLMVGFNPQAIQNAIRGS